MSPTACPGDALTALVDGELTHAARERVLTHLAHCAGCRAEVDAQRRMKARLAGAASGPAPSPALTDRLLALAVPGTELRGPRAPVAARPVSIRPPARPAGAARPAGGPVRTRHRLAVGSCLLLLGVTAALALGGSGGGSSPLVDPGSETFVTDFASTRSEVPFADPAVGVASLTSR